MLKLAFSLLLVITTFNAFTQDSSTVRPTKKIPFSDDRLFNGIRVGTDVAGLAYSFITKGSSFKLTDKYEITADVGIKRWYINFDAGTGKFERFDDNLKEFRYTSTGKYIRLGGDYRISKSAKSFLFFGGRLGQGWFREEGTYVIPGVSAGKGQIIRDAVVDNFDRSFVIRWVEMTPGIKVHLLNNIYLGYTIRLKFLIPSKKLDEYVPLDMPGYGVYRTTNLGFSFHIMYRFPNGRDPEVPLRGR